MPKSRLSNLVKGTATDIVIFGLGSAIPQALGFLLIPIYTRELTPSEFGVMALLTTVMSMSATLFQLALDGALLRSYFDYDTEQERQTVFGTAFLLVLSSVTVAISLAFVLDSWLSEVIFETQGYAPHLLVVIATAGVTILSGLPLILYRARRLVARYSVIQAFLFLLRLGLIIHFVVVRKWGVWGVVVGGFWSTVVGTGFLYLLLLGQLKLRFSWYEAKRMLFYGLPLVPGRVMFALLLTADRYFLEHYSTLATVGIYALGLKFGFIIQVMLVQPFKFVWPVMAFSVKDKGYAKAYYARILTYYLYVGFFLTLIISLTVRDVLKWVTDPSYWEAYRVVPMICLGLLLFGAQKLIDVGIFIQRKTKNIPLITGVGLLVNLALNWILVPHWAAMGAAIANIVSYAAMSGVTYWISRRLLPVNYEWGRIIKMVAVAVVLYFVGVSVSLDEIYSDLVVKILLAITFPVLIGLLGFYRSEERRQLRLACVKLRSRFAQRLGLPRGTASD